MFKKISVTLGLVITLIVNTACFGSSSLGRLNDLIPLVPSTVDTLVVTGVLEEEQGRLIKNDFEDGLKAVDKAKASLAKGTSKAIVYTALADDWRLIVARNHFAQANHPKVNAIAGYVTSIVTILANKYNQPAGARGSSDFDKQLDVKIDALERELKNK